MEKRYVHAEFDRKHTAEKTGFGKVELLITVSPNIKRYLVVKDCNKYEWRRYQKDEELLSRVRIFNEIIRRMINEGEDMTLENVEEHLGIRKKETKVQKAKKEHARFQTSPTGFIDFFKAEVAKEHLAPATLSRRNTVLDSIVEFGQLNKFKDLTPENIRAYDEFLHEDDKRQDQTVICYHKILKKFITLAFDLEYITKNPYKSPLCKFNRGEYKERKPLSEDELVKIRCLELNSQKEERARDLFIFSAYTGLAYVDMQNFDFYTMTEKQGNTYYIDGARVKTGHTFFTPILPPAMEVLIKYNFHLPRISNQKLNDYLHLIEAKAGINKSMTTHVARHSFATLVLSHDIPIENVARMMGHTNVKTTQIYAKVLKKTIERHTETLIDKLELSVGATTPKVEEKTADYDIVIYG